jgi:hypothetical protein
MIYFVVNNNYQYLEAERLAKELKGQGKPCGLIAIPHTLSLPLEQTTFDLVAIMQTPARGSWLRAWFKYLAIHPSIQALVAPAAGDSVLLFTEFELLNQLVAMRFKTAGAKVYLVEDGGVGSYIPLTLRHPQPYTLKDRLYTWMVRVIPRLQRTQFTKFDGIIFPMLSDRYIDAVLLYRHIDIVRQLPVTVLQRPAPQAIVPTAGRVVFLNQPFYAEHIQTPQVYAEGLRKILAALSAGFAEVYFKFHPRESVQAQEKITADVLRHFPQLNMIGSDAPFESMLTTLRPEAVASYNSTPLFNLVGTGVQPLFVYTLLDDLVDQPSFRAMHDLLAAWHYPFPAHWRDLRSGFLAGGNFDRAEGGLALGDVLDPASAALPCP